MKKVIAIVGPTAIGKTKISVEIAKRLGLEIISGDSVAVYKRLDIGSAKPTKKEMNGVKHHLISVLEPDKQYTTFDFQKMARDIIDQSEKPLVIAGGTGLYIKSAIFNYEFEAPKRNEDDFKNLSNDELYEILGSLDPDFDREKIHINNRKRIIRAIEIVKSTNKKLADYNEKDKPLYDYYIVYLNLDRDILYERINERVDEMFDLGLEDEVYSLYKDGIYPHAIGYKEFIPYFNKEITLETVKDEIKKNTRHLAKRQITWFKNQMDTHFYLVNLNDINQTIDEIYNDLKVFLEKWEYI